MCNNENGLLIVRGGFVIDFIINVLLFRILFRFVIEICIFFKNVVSFLCLFGLNIVKMFIFFRDGFEKKFKNF